MRLQLTALGRTLSQQGDATPSGTQRPSEQGKIYHKRGIYVK